MQWIPSAPLILAAATASQTILVMLLIVGVLVSLQLLSQKRNDDDDPYVEKFYMCESCGEELDEEVEVCPVCGGKLQTVERRFD